MARYLWHLFAGYNHCEGLKKRERLFFTGKKDVLKVAGSNFISSVVSFQAQLGGF